MWVRISLLAYILMCQSVRTNFAPARVNAMYILIFLSLSFSFSFAPSIDRRRYALYDYRTMIISAV